MSDQALGGWFHAMTNMTQGTLVDPHKAVVWGRLLGALVEEFVILTFMVKDTSGELVFGCDICQEYPRSVHNDANHKVVGFRGVANGGFRKVSVMIGGLLSRELMHICGVDAG
jgi:hypothetical protein